MYQVTESEIRRRLAFDNPWWEEGAVPRRFRDWPQRVYLRGFLELVRGKARRAVVLLGPRRVGKTVLLHQAIQALIDDGVAPRAIFYIAVDTPVYSGLTLEKLLWLFLDLHNHRKTARLFVCLDEIQYQPKWEAHLKSLVDSFPDIRFVVSGSAAAALRMRSVESGAGRFTEFLLPPLTFAEFLRFTGAATPGDEEPNAEEIAELNRRFIDYLNFGGFPEAVMDDTVRRSMDRYIANDIIDKVLLRDLPSLYGISDTQELNRLFATLAYNTGNEVNLEELSKASNVAKNTLRKYLDYLEAAFLIQRLHRVDQNARRFQRVTHFKVYLTNPCIRVALFGAVAAADEAMGRLAETALVSQIAHSRIIDRLYYSRWAAGEVDLVLIDVRSQQPLAPLEIKWSDRAVDEPKAELRALVSFCKANRIDKAWVLVRSRFASRVVLDVALNYRPIAFDCYAAGKALVEAPIGAGWHPRSDTPLGGRRRPRAG